MNEKNFMVMEENNAVSLCATREDYISVFGVAMSDCQRVTWIVAKVVYETVKSANFKEIFGTIEEYAKAVHMTKGHVSNMVKAYGRKKTLETKGDFTLSQVQEFNTLKQEDIIPCIEKKHITDSMSVKDIREAIKEYKECPDEVEEIGITEIESEDGEAEEKQEKQEKQEKKVQIMFTAIIDSEVVCHTNADTETFITEKQLKAIRKILGF